MIFYFNATGEPIAVSPNRVFQGSNKVNTIYFICPLQSTNVVTASFILPNGVRVDKQMMVCLSNDTLTDAMGQLTEGVNVWKYQLSRAITGVEGVVRVCFYSSDANGEITTTCQSSFTVEKGLSVENVSSDDSDTLNNEHYAELISQLLGIDGRLLDTEEELKKLVASKIAKTDVNNNFTVSQTVKGTVTANTPTEQAHLTTKGYVDQKVEPLQTEVEKTKDNLDLLYTISQSTNVFAIAQVEDEYQHRVTGGGLNVIDGTPATLKKISGKTVRVAIDGQGKYVLESSSVKAIESLGKNLAEIDDVTVLGSQAQNSVTKLVTGLTASEYTLMCDYSQNTLLTTVGVCVKSYDGQETYAITSDNKKTGKLTVTFTLPSGESGISVGLYSNMTGQVMDSNCTFSKFMLVSGQNNVEYQPYVKQTIEFNSAIETGLGVIIDCENKKVIKNYQEFNFENCTVDKIMINQSKTTENMLFIYGKPSEFNNAISAEYQPSNAICSRCETNYNNATNDNGVEAFAINNNSYYCLSLFKSRLDNGGFGYEPQDILNYFKTESLKGNPYIVRFITNTQTVEDLSVDALTYTAYDGGTERVISGENKNQVENTITQEYYIVGGNK